MRNSWGKGYATEAAIAIRDVFAAKEEITRLSSIAIEDNVASISIMTKLGMEFTKTDIYSDPLLGELEVVYYHLEV
jgi:RimJ/RimL family protein N-acetyltransferase